MPVKIKVGEVVRARNLNIKQFAELARMSYPTAMDWYHGTPRRVELEMLANVCNALGVGLLDVLEYVPDHEETKS